MGTSDILFVGTYLLNGLRGRMPDHTPNLRVLTANIFGHHADWPSRRPVVREEFRALNPDIVCLQETMRAPSENQARKVVGDAYNIIDSEARSDDHTGISIASRWPVVRCEELDLKPGSNRTAGFACTTRIAIIEAPTFGTMVAANHFPDFQVDHEYERERQTALAVSARGRYVESADHILLMGDLDFE
jgi:endonuclease/exonuclease/phosphatase family metal-dependent hydrolase